MTDPTTDLKSIGSNGQPPKSRLSSAKVVRAMFERYKRANERRSRRNALVKGMVDGNPPYDQSALDSNAQRFRANFNSGEAESFLGTAITAFYDLFSEVENFATVHVELDDAEAATWGDIITREFDRLQRLDDSMDFTVQKSQADMVLFGYGPQIWDDPLDWRSRAIPHSDMLLPDEAAANVNDWERVMFRATYRVDELHRYIADEEAARMAGWNIAAVRRSLVRCTQNHPSHLGVDEHWEAFQQRLRNNDLEIGESCPKIRCARLLYREFSTDGSPGLISEAWVDLDDVEDEFLYQRQDSHEDMRQAVCAFFYDRGDGFAHSVRGLGVKMFRLLMAKMRLQNAVVDAAFARAAIMLKALGGAQEQGLAVTHMGPYTIVPSGYELIPTGVPGILDAPMAVGRELDNTLAANLSQYRQRLDKPDGNPRTATEVSHSAQQASLLNKTQIARYYQQLDEWYSERFRRASNPDIPRTTRHKWAKKALEFQRRCAEAGVPRKAFENARVSATRTVGQGSVWARIQMLNQIFASLYSLLPEDGKERLVGDMIAAQAGRQQVSRYLPVPKRREGEAQHRWEAQVENDTFRNRGQVTLTPWQNDIIHAQEHLAFAAQAAQSLQSGANPMEIYGIIQAIGPHIAMHLERLSASPLRNAEAKALYEQLKSLSKIADHLAKQIKQAMAEQQERAAAEAKAKAVETGADPETRIKAAQAAHDMQLKDAKAHQAMALKAAKTRQDMALADARAAQEMANGSP